MSKNIKIAVCFHKEQDSIPDFIKDKDIYIHVHGGRELYNGNSQFLLNMNGDNDCPDNISKYNPYINEMTVIYYLYKNINKLNADYYGLFHYRRFLNYNINDLSDNKIICSRVGFYQSVYEHFCIFHKHKQLIDEFIEWYKSRLNDNEKNIFNKFLSERYLYFANLFIMPKDIFKQYGMFIEQLIKKCIQLLQKYKIDDQRYYGFLLQRMTGYFIYKSSFSGVNICIKNVIS